MNERFTVSRASDGTYAIWDNWHLGYDGQRHPYQCWTGIEHEEDARSRAATMNRSQEERWLTEVFGETV